MEVLQFWLRWQMHDDICESARKIYNINGFYIK